MAVVRKEKSAVPYRRISAVHEIDNKDISSLFEDNEGDPVIIVFNNEVDALRPLLPVNLRAANNDVAYPLVRQVQGYTISLSQE